jgi:hypothetical protein
MPGGAQGPSQFAVGFGVVDEAFLVRVPLQLALQMKGAPVNENDSAEKPI